MIYIPGGIAIIGCDHFYAEEKPVRETPVDAVLFDPHPVTNAEFARFVVATSHVTVAEIAPNPLEFPGADLALLVPGSQVFNQPQGPVPLDDWKRWWRWQPGANWREPNGDGVPWEEIADHPVVHIGWEDAMAYARWADKDLPTEVEWEHAARGGLLMKDFTWGDVLSPNGSILANTWQGPFPWRSDDPDGFDRTSPVCSYPPNDYGLYDMIGNVWEWTRTRWTESHHERPVDAPAMNASCCGGSIHQSESSRMVTKGGSHLCSPDYCQRYRPAARQGQGINDTTSHLGFRCVRRLQTRPVLDTARRFSVDLPQ